MLTPHFYFINYLGTPEAYLLSSMFDINDQNV